MTTDRPRPLRVLTGMLVTSLALGLAVAGVALPGALIAGLGARAVADHYLSLPDRIEEPPLPARSVMLDAHGNPFATFTAYDRVPVALTDVAPVMRRAVIATEDARFAEHHGYDPVGILRAVASNAAGDSGLQGASTITQQYVKNTLSLAAELGSTDTAAVHADSVSVGRKLRELRLSIALEETLTKDEILQRYLNIAYFGAGSYGVQAAARRYYSVDAADLNLTQAATLTGLLKNPTGYDPLTYPVQARERRNIVLGRMRAEGVISARAHRRAAAAGLRLRPSKPANGCDEADWPFYCEQVLHLLRNDPAFGDTGEDRARLLAVGGLRIHTPLRPAMMRTADTSAKQVVPPTHRVATAVAVVEPGTGHVVAIGSSKRYGSGAVDRTQIVLPAVQAFQPGSTFKAFTLAAALDSGMPLSTRLPGGSAYTSSVYDNPAKGYYSNSAGSPSNVTLTRATQMSMNTAFVQLMEKVGIDRVARTARALGVTSTGPTGRFAPGSRQGSYTLGVVDTSVVDMANAYASIAASGSACPATFITRVTLAGADLAVPGGECRQVIDPAAADTVAHVLGTVVADGTGRPAQFGRPAAGKTGTTENLGAAWFAGFTPQYATAVWVGDPRGPSYSLRNVLGYSSVYGGTLPASVWRRTMAGIHAGLPVEPLPGPDPSYVVTGSGKLLPRVSGMAVDDARDRLAVAGVGKVRVETVPVAAGQRPGIAVGTTPASGTPITGRPVTVHVTR